MDDWFEGENLYHLIDYIEAGTDPSTTPDLHDSKHRHFYLSRLGHRPANAFLPTLIEGHGNED